MELQELKKRHKGLLPPYEDIYINDRLLEQLNEVVQLIDPFPEELYEYGPYNLHFCTIFGYRYTQNKIKDCQNIKAKYVSDIELHNTLKSFSIDLDQFWYILIWIKDYIDDFAVNSTSYYPTARKSITNFCQLMNSVNNKYDIFPKGKCELTLKIDGKKKATIDNTSTLKLMSRILEEWVNKHTSNVSDDREVSGKDKCTEMASVALESLELDSKEEIYKEFDINDKGIYSQELLSAAFEEWTKRYNDVEDVDLLKKTYREVHKEFGIDIDLIKPKIETERDTLSTTDMLYLFHKYMSIYLKDKKADKVIADSLSTPKVAVCLNKGWLISRLAYIVGIGSESLYKDDREGKKLKNNIRKPNLEAIEQHRLSHRFYRY